MARTGRMDVRAGLVCERGGVGGRRRSEQLPRTSRLMRQVPLVERNVRVALRGVGTLLAALALAWLASSALVEAEAARRIETVGVTTVTVVSGDSLWTIAERHPVDGLSTRTVVDWIAEANGLSSALVLPGRRLVVPSGA